MEDRGNRPAARKSTKKSGAQGKGKGLKQKQPNPAVEAAELLQQNPTAKIVIVIDTHCLDETGGFIWSGTEPSTFEACSLKEVRIIPPGTME